LWDSSGVTRIGLKYYECTYHLGDFDFDYTLADSSAGEVECVNYALRAMNLPPAANSDIHTMIGVSLPETFRRLTREANQTRSDEFVELFIKRADEVMLNYIVLFDSSGLPSNN